MLIECKINVVCRKMGEKMIAVKLVKRAWKDDGSGLIKRKMCQGRLMERGRVENY